MESFAFSSESCENDAHVIVSSAAGLPRSESRRKFVSKLWLLGNGRACGIGKVKPGARYVFLCAIIHELHAGFEASAALALFSVDPCQMPVTWFLLM